MPSINEARGYGKVHQQTKERWRPVVEAGEATCARCLGVITPPGEVCPRCFKTVAKGRPSRGYCGWDLGHDDHDRTIYTGPEHACCNRRAGGRRAARTTSLKRSARVWSRQWLSD